MPFKKGKSGNPRGRPQGSRNKATIACEELLDGEAKAITRKAIELAKNGDGYAMRLCLERLLPPRKDRPVTFVLPNIASADDAMKVYAALLKAVAAGDVTPAEAGELSRVVDGFGRAIEATEHERRLATLEAALADKIKAMGARA